MVPTKCHRGSVRVEGQDWTVKTAKIWLLTVMTLGVFDRKTRPDLVTVSNYGAIYGVFTSDRKYCKS